MSVGTFLVGLSLGCGCVCCVYACISVGFAVVSIARC